RAAAGVNVALPSTSESRIAVVTAESKRADAVRAAAAWVGAHAPGEPVSEDVLP
ncbi:hypothetical protein JRF68_13105, partial [Micrococcus luteus]|nr:hypothetical protein [Micrococcus luteus]